MFVASSVGCGDEGEGVAALLPQIIGQIQTAIGYGTLRRANGIAVQVTVGDPVCQGDVIETAADGRIGIRFIDGTAFNLSGGTRVTLNEFVCDSSGTSRSAVFAVSRGTFGFIAGQVAKTGCLSVETPVGSIRGRAHIGGVGTLSLAALAFSIIKEVQAADSNVTFLDDDNIAYKDMAHGAFELVTKEPIPRHIIVEDPGATVILSPRGSSISVNQVTNSAARMAELQEAQQDVLANFARGPNGSSSLPIGNPLPVQPINFIQTDITNPQNQLPVLESEVFIVPEIIIVRPTLAITGIAGQIGIASDNIINASRANAGVEITGTTSGVEDGQVVTVTIVDSSNHVVHNSRATVTNSTWSIDLSSADARALADGIYTLTADVSNVVGISANASQAIRVDETPPTIAIDTIVSNNVVNANVASAGFAIAGTTTDAESGQPVTIKIVDSSGHVVDTFTTTLANNTWSINVTSTEAKLLRDGTYTVTADVSDSAGNPAPEATQAIAVDETLPTVTWLPPAESGIEGTAIALGTITATANSLPGHSNSVQSLVVSAIPVGAVLTDGTNNFVATSGNTSVDVKSWNLSSLKITPPNDTNFILTITATDQDANTASTSELVTVAPLPPDLHPVAAQGNEDTAIALQLGVTVTNLSGVNGDASLNSLNTLVVSDIPVGATLSDGTGLPGHSFTAAAGNTSFDVANWNLSSLKITPLAEFEGSFTLTIAATEHDLEGNTSATVTATEVVTVTPVAEPPTASAPATLALNENATGAAVAGVNVGPLAEDNDDTVSATLTVSHGTLHVASLSGVTVSGDDCATLTLSGSAAAVNMLLAGLTYTPTVDYEGSDTLHLSVTSSDGSNTYPTAATASTAITVNPVAEPPTASAPARATTAVNTAIDISGVVVGPAAEDADDTVIVLLTVAHGALAVSPVAGVTETVNGLGSLTVSGTASDVNTALASLVYTPITHFIGSDTLNVSVTSRDGSETYPTQATAATAIAVTLNSESLIVGGPGPTLDWNDPANWSGGVVPTLSINATINAPSNYKVIITGTPDAQAESLTIPHGAASTDIIVNGTLQLAGDLNVSDSGKLENDGKLEEEVNATFIGPITNNGTIIADPNVYLHVTGTITGVGNVWIDSGSTIEFAPGSKLAPGTTDSQIVYFEQGAGKLIIDDWGKFAGVITGTDIGTHLTSAALIDLTQLPFVGGSMSASVLYNSGTNISTITFSDGNSANNVTLRFSGNYTGTTWTFTSVNGGAGTEIRDPPTDSGTVTVDSGATVEIAAASTQTIDFAYGSKDAAIISGAATGSVIVAGGVANATPGTPLVTGKLADTDVDNAPNNFTLVSSPTASDGGYGAFTMTAAGMWTYTLDNNNSVVDTPKVGDTLTDTFTVHSADGTAQAVTIAIHGASDAAPNDFDNPGTHVISDPPFVFGTPGHDSIAGGGDEGQIINGGAGDDTINGAGKSDVLYGGSGNDTIKGGDDTIYAGSGSDTINGNNGNDTFVGGFGANLLTGGIGNDRFDYLSATDSHAAPFNTITDFRSGSDKIDLTAFGALAFAVLALTSTSTSVPAHTIAWLYDGTSNETIVYVNPTDETLSIGSSSLVEIHLQGISTVEASDFVIEPATAPAAVAGEPVNLDPAATAVTDGAVVATTSADATSNWTANGALLADGNGTVPTTDVGNNFDADRGPIDWIGSAGFASSGEAQTHPTEDANDNAVITPANGPSMAPHSVHLAGPMANNLTFSPAPVPDSAGAMTIGDGAAMPLNDAVSNINITAPNATVDSPEQQLNAHDITPEGDGRIAHSHNHSNASSEASPVVASNDEDDAISSGDHAGNGELIPTNAGTINAAGTHGHAIDTGSSVEHHSGGPEASGNHGVAVAGSTAHSGHPQTDGGSQTVSGEADGHGVAAVHGTGEHNSEASSISDMVFGPAAGGTHGLGDSFHFKSAISASDGPGVSNVADLELTPGSASHHENAAAQGTPVLSEEAQTIDASPPGHHSTHIAAPDHAHVPHDLVV